MSNTSTKAQTRTEGRRFRARELKEQGWKQQDIARALGVTPGAVSQWMRRGREGGGPEALRGHPAAGPSPRLSKSQLSQIPRLLSKGAECYGFVGQVWTAPRVARVIKRVFGVSYHETHVRRLLKAMDWTSQKPVQQASQRDEEAIAAWRGEVWAVLKEKPRKKREPSSEVSPFV